MEMFRFDVFYASPPDPEEVFDEIRSVIDSYVLDEDGVGHILVSADEENPTHVTVDVEAEARASHHGCVSRISACLFGAGDVQQVTCRGAL